MKKLFVFALIVSIFSSCTVNEGEGFIVTQTLEIEDFSALEVSDDFDIIITEGPEQKVVAEGQQNIIDKIKTNVSNSTWNAVLENGIYRDYDMTIRITTPFLNKIKNNSSGNIKSSLNVTDSRIEMKIDGSGDIEATGRLEATFETRLEIDGSGDIIIDDLTTPKTVALLDGSGKMEVTGTSPRAIINIDGSGDFLGFNLITDICTVEMDASGTCEVYADGTLDVLIDGSGDVYYKGSADVSQHIDGTGRVVNAN